MGTIPVRFGMSPGRVRAPSSCGDAAGPSEGTPVRVPSEGTPVRVPLSPPAEPAMCRGSFTVRSVPAPGPPPEPGPPPVPGLPPAPGFLPAPASLGGGLWPRCPPQTAAALFCRAPGAPRPRQPPALAPTPPLAPAPARQRRARGQNPPPPALPAPNSGGSEFARGFHGARGARGAQGRVWGALPAVPELRVRVRGSGGGWRRPARRGAAAGRWRWPRCHIALDHGGRRALTRHFPEGAAGAAVTPLRAGGAGPRLGGIPLLLPPSPPPALPRCCSPSFLIAAPHPCPPSLPASLYPQPLLVLPSAPPRCGSGVLWGSVRGTRRDGAQAAAALPRDPLRGVLGTPVLPVWLPQLCWVSQRWGLSRSATPLCPPGWGSCASPGGAPGDASAFTSAPPGLGSPRAWQLWGGHPTGSAPQ